MAAPVHSYVVTVQADSGEIRIYDPVKSGHLLAACMEVLSIARADDPSFELAMVTRADLSACGLLLSYSTVNGFAVVKTDRQGN